MKRLGTITLLLAIGLIAYAALVPVATSQPSGWLSFMVQDPQAVVRFRALGQYGAPVMIGNGTAVPTVANSGVAPMDGELFIVTAGATEPDLQFWSTNSGAWHSVAQIDIAETFGAAVTVTGALTANGDITLGSDEIDTVTINAPVRDEIWRDDFCNVGVMQNDGTAESGVDAEVNWIYTASGGQYTDRIEQTATINIAEQEDSGCGLDVSGDVTANDGHEIVFTENPLLGVHEVQAASDEFYFEISITIADISAFDGDWATGIRLPEAQQDPPQHDGLNTYAIFTLSDNAGDLDFECDVDGGGAVNDDTGTTWADGATHVLRVEVDGDGYGAYVDGTAVTLTNCNAGANDFTDGDKVVPFYYHTQGAEGAATGVVINYVEWGEGVI